MARPMDIAPPRAVPFAETGLDGGWEGITVMTLTLALLSFGLVTLYSASGFQAQSLGYPDYFYVVRQAAGAAVGLAAMVVCARIPYSWWARLAWPMLLGTILLLLLVILPGTESISPEVNGARRWLTIGGVTFQPSELAKLSVIIWSAALAVKKQEHFRSLGRGLGPFLVMWGIVLVLVLLEPDLSTAGLIGIVAALIVFAAGARIAHFAALGLFALPLLWSQLGVNFRAQRILAFLDPSADPAGAGFQVRQSLVGMGSGGWTGVGFGEGRQKFGFLPEIHNDFIFSMIGEEWGFLGVTFTVLLYLAIVMVGFRVARRAPDLFGQLLAIGVSSLLAVQAILHMCVGLSLAPATGLALPLVSYGRSNLLVTLAALGILISVSRACPGGKVRHA